VDRIRPESLSLFRKALRHGDKILISGAAGWFGQTAIAMTKTTGLEYLATGSRSRVIELNGENEKIESHDMNSIAAFKPTVVIDAAFLTREKIAVTGAANYIEINQAIMDCSKEIVGLASVRKYVGFSSGATVNLAGHDSFNILDNPYAALKRSYEEQMLDAGSWSKASITIPRVFSLTGAYVNRPDLFAFSNLILQARSGEISIRARRRVLRRYCLVEDVIALSVSSLDQGETLIFETGGDLVEIGELAHLIKAQIDTEMKIIRSLDQEESSDNYFSSGLEWSSLSKKQGLLEETISKQIARFLASVDV
jgi:nucleoside-diphosphate-sugar epimerase